MTATQTKLDALKQSIAEIVAMTIIERPNGSGLTWAEAEEIGHDVADRLVEAILGGPLPDDR